MSEDFLIHTIAPEGTGDRVMATLPVAGSGPRPGYTWPTWSPDARSILLSAVVPDPQSRAEILAAYIAIESSPETPLLEVLQDPVGSQGILAGVFHYALWSPDSKRVALIAVAGQDLAVFLSRLDDAPARPIIGGAPLYVTWSWDSQHMFVHQRERLLDYDVTGGTITGLGASPLYQAPVAAPVPGGRLAYVVDTFDGASEVTVSETDGIGGARSVLDVRDLAALQWSPDGRLLAIGRTPESGGFNFAELLLVDVDSGEVRPVLKSNIVAFEWSPDGSRILVATDPPSEPGVTSWSVLDVASGAITQVVNMRLTDEFAQMLTYFDQYAQSHRLWGPDSRHFVLAGDLASNPQPAADYENERVWVFDARGEEAPVAIAEGYLAFWSPR